MRELFIAPPRIEAKEDDRRHGETWKGPGTEQVRQVQRTWASSGDQGTNLVHSRRGDEAIARPIERETKVTPCH